MFSTSKRVLFFYWFEIKSIIAAFSLDVLDCHQSSSICRQRSSCKLKWRQVNFEKICGRKRFLFVQEQFNIEQLMPEQKQCIRPCLEKGNVFVNLLTGVGNSLVFQCLPIVADIIHMRDRG